MTQDDRTATSPAPRDEDNKVRNSPPGRQPQGDDQCPDRDERADGDQEHTATETQDLARAGRPNYDLDDVEE